MLRPYLLRSTQPHSGGLVGSRDYSRDRGLDRAVLVASVSQLAPGRERPGHHVAAQVVYSQLDQTPGAVPVHADLRK